MTTSEKLKSDCLSRPTFLFTVTLGPPLLVFYFHHTYGPCENLQYVNNSTSYGKSAAVMKPLSKDITRARRHEIHRRAMEGELKLPGAVRDMRNALGFTQAKFAKHFGLSIAHLSAIETGKANPTAEVLTKIGHPFGFQLGFVLREKPKMRKHLTLPPEVEVLVQLCKTEMHAVEVWLFGSRARGDHRPDSDYDILAVVADDAPEGVDTPMAAFELRRRSKAHADLLTGRMREVIGARDVPNTLSYIVAREGVRIDV